jgi:hypothetical protein
MTIEPAATLPRAIVTEAAERLFARMAAMAAQPAPGDTDALQELLNLGLLRADPSHGYILVDPQYVGARVEGALYSEAATMLKRAASVSDALHGLRRSYDTRAAETAGLIECHRGSEAINWRLGQVLSGCTTELLVCQPGAARRPESIREAAGRDLDALKRGVVMRTLYHDHAHSGAGMDEWVAMMTAAGAEIRTLAEPFERMIVIDRRIVVIPGDQILMDSKETVAYIVNDGGVAGFLARRFHHDWERANGWDERGGDTPLSRRQVAVLRGLAAGEAQAQIARRLGIAQRTMAETIAELKVTYGVTTLFQLACRWKESGGSSVVPEGS